MKGVIFDLDGTMVNNMMVHHQAWQIKLRELGLELEIDEVRERVHGINEEILERLFGDRLTPEERRYHSFGKEAHYRRIFKPELCLIDGLEGFLARLRKAGFPLGIGSAAPPENVDFVLDNLRIRGLFQAALSSSDVSAGKPDPEIYHKVAGKLGFDASECLVFEDSPTGAEAARRAGSKVVIVTSTHSEDEFDGFPNVIRFIQNFRDLDIPELALRV